MELHALIADAYLQLEKYRLARVWVESIYGPLHSWDRRHNREKFPLRLPEVNGAQPAVYADLLVVAARISIVHGHDRDAIEELHEASRLDPSNETVDRMMEECKTHLEARSERRRSKKAQQAASAQRKYQGICAKASRVFTATDILQRHFKLFTVVKIRLMRDLATTICLLPTRNMKQHTGKFELSKTPLTDTSHST